MFNDSVNRPTHYTTGNIEVIDFIEDKGLNFHRGNALKYIVRAGLKDKTKEIEDLKKAIWYINREIERISHEPLNPVQIDRIPRISGKRAEDQIARAILENYADGREFTRQNIVLLTGFSSTTVSNILNSMLVRGEIVSNGNTCDKTFQVNNHGSNLKYQLDKNNMVISLERT